jgi:hypothetical protein
LKKRSKKRLPVLASAFPDGLSLDNQKFFGSRRAGDPTADPVQILRFVDTRRDLPRALADLASQPNEAEND